MFNVNASIDFLATDESLKASIATAVEDLNSLIRLAKSRGITAHIKTDKALVTPTGATFEPVQISLSRTI